MIWTPRVTVAAVIEQDGKFLCVEESIAGQRVLNQPAGHLEAGESLQSAVIREVLEETARRFVPTALVGVYLWPMPGTERSYLRFCFYGDPSLGAVTDSLIDKRAHGHPIDVRKIRRGGAVSDCHVMYVDVSERVYVRPLLELTRDMPILTVSEIDDFAAAGGVIGLTYRGNKPKFEINTAAAQRAQLSR